MNLVVDVGNTRIKYAFFDGDRFVEARYQTGELLEEISKWKNAGNEIHLLLSGSGRVPDDMRLLLKEASDSFWEASSGMALPLKLGYGNFGI